RCRRESAGAAGHRAEEFCRVGIRRARRRTAARHRAADAARDAPPAGRDRAGGDPAAARTPPAGSLRAKPAALDRLAFAGFLRHARDAHRGPGRGPRGGAPAGAQPASGADDQRPRRLLAALVPAGAQGTLAAVSQACMAGEPAGLSLGTSRYFVHCTCAGDFWYNYGVRAPHDTLLRKNPSWTRASRHLPRPPRCPSSPIPRRDRAPCLCLLGGPRPPARLSPGRLVPRRTRTTPPPALLRIVLLGRNSRACRGSVRAGSLRRTSARTPTWQPERLLYKAPEA